MTDPVFTAKGSVLTEYLIGLLTNGKEALGLKDIFYCDQANIPNAPTVCVEPANVARELIGVPLRTNNEFNISVLVYGADITGVDNAQRAADLVSEAVTDYINADGREPFHGGTQFGGSVIYGYVERSVYGYVVKSNKVFRANRLMVYALSKTNLLET